MREEYGRLLATGAAVVKADFGAVGLTRPVMQRVGERPTDPLTAVVAPFQRAGRTERTVPVDGREVAVRYRARAGRHQVEVDGHHGEVLLDAPPGVELRR